MANTSDIRNGLCIKHNDKLFQIIEFQHVKPGKGPAFVRTKMRQIESGKVLDHTFSAGHKIDPVRIENREYHQGKRMLCGVEMPEGMKENDAFPVPIITPAVKAAEGHDEDISREDILAHGHVPEAIYLQMESYTRALFARGTQMAKERGLILVDTKYEFGLKDGQVILIDEIHTPDSSRYFYANGYEERQRNGEPQKQLSKEFVRQWLIEQGFQGLEGQQMPVMPDDFVELVSQRYIELYEKITGESFIKDAQEDMIARINERVSEYLMS